MDQTLYLNQMFPDYEPPEELHPALSQAAIAAADIDPAPGKIQFQRFSLKTDPFLRYSVFGQGKGGDLQFIKTPRDHAFQFSAQYDFLRICAQRRIFDPLNGHDISDIPFLIVVYIETVAVFMLSVKDERDFRLSAAGGQGGRLFLLSAKHPRRRQYHHYHHHCRANQYAMMSPPHPFPHHHTNSKSSIVSSSEPMNCTVFANALARWLI